MASRSRGVKMERRDFVKIAAASMMLKPDLDFAYYGLIPGNHPGKSFYQVSNLDGFGKGKQAFLCNAYQKVTKEKWYPIDQFMGDCVGVAVTTAVDFLNVTQTMQRKTSWEGNHSIIASYVGGRKMAGRSPTGDGAKTIWILDFLKKYGVLLKKKYGADDLRHYNNSTYRQYKKGLTDNLKIEAQKHPLLHAEKLQSYEETRDAIAAGYPGIIASSMGVRGAKKNKDGFFKPSGYTPHCMCCIGVDDKDRPSILIQNSHGANWAPGPKRYGFEPEGSAWVDADVFDRYIRSFNDSWTISLFKGYKVIPKYVLW